jgi:hypothetical protein
MSPILQDEQILKNSHLFCPELTDICEQLGIHHVYQRTDAVNKIKQYIDN